MPKSKMFDPRWEWDTLEPPDRQKAPLFGAISMPLLGIAQLDGVDFIPKPEAVDMNGRFQMQGGKNWFLPKEMNANRFFCVSHWLEIWSNHFYPSMGPNGGSVAMDSGIYEFGYWFICT
jgi:hypothetical protein